MSSVVVSYKLGSIEVEITEYDNLEKLSVVCNDGNYRSEFTIRKYDYDNYMRHMNQRIKTAYNEKYDDSKE